MGLHLLFNSLYLLATAYTATASVLQMVLLLESLPSTPLNGSLRNFNAWRASVGNRTLRSDFWVSPHKNWGPKTTYFRRLRNSMAILRANIFGKEHDIDNRKRRWKLQSGA